ncbi:MAG: hypothetical protein WBO43_02680 [Gemmatimonadota bacterium]
MNMKRITLALAVAVFAGLATGELRAQEFALPPAPSSATEDGGRAFLPESGPCFYNPYRWMVRGAVNQSMIAAEMQDLAAGGTSPGSGCLGHYAVTGADLFGPWSYMLSDGIPQPERVSQEKVKAVWDASRKAAAEAEAKERLGHVWVPTIGNGHGSDEPFVGRTLVFRAAPAPTPATYNGIPIVERNRSWERFETTDGQRVWRVVEPNRDSYGRRPGVQVRNGALARFRSSGDRRIQLEEGARPAPRSLPRLPAQSSASTGSSSASNSSSGTKTQTPRVNKTREQ